MDPIYVGDLIPSIASSKKIIKRYDKGIKEGEFYEEPIGADFIREGLKSMDKNPTIDDFVKIC